MSNRNAPLADSLEWQENAENSPKEDLGKNKSYRKKKDIFVKISICEKCEATCS